MTNAKPCPDPAAFANTTWPNCPDKLFQFHHQALNYFASFAPGTPARAAHLRDETEFEALAAGLEEALRLKPVSIIKPIGAENEHPGYTNVTSGSTHLVDLLSSIQNSRCAKDTMVVVTYDEFGGQWDHVRRPARAGRRASTTTWARAPASRRSCSRRPARRLRRRPRHARHDVDHGHDRAPLRPASGVHARRRGQRSVERVLRRGPRDHYGYGR